MTIRLVATDLDGSFLDENGTVSAINLQALNCARELEIPVVVATGRPSRWLSVLDDLLIFDQVIVSNGAARYHRNQRILTHTVQLACDPMLSAVADLRASIPGVSFAVEMGTIFGREPHTPSTERDGPHVHTDDITDLVCKPGVIKFMAYHEYLSSSDLYQACKKWQGQFEVTYSTTNETIALVEFGPANVTKATAIAQLCRELGIAAAEVIAFGDMPNDLAMLEFAGVGIAMGNAHPDLYGFPHTESHIDSGVGREILRRFGNYPQFF